MKNIFLALTILFALSCKAQSPIISLTDDENDYPLTENIYIKDTEGLFNPYIGVWKWGNGNDSFTITIRKVERVYLENSPIKRYVDKLYGDIRYIKNGVEIISPLMGEKLLSIADTTPVDGEYRFSFKDPIKNKYGKVFITLLNNNTQIKFYLRNNEGGRLLKPGEVFDPEFSIPRRTDIILTKQ